jgi:hypothetical protein
VIARGRSVRSRSVLHRLLPRRGGRRPHRRLPLPPARRSVWFSLGHATAPAPQCLLISNISTPQEGFPQDHRPRSPAQQGSWSGGYLQNVAKCLSLRKCAAW